MKRSAEITLLKTKMCEFEVQHERKRINTFERKRKMQE